VARLEFLKKFNGTQIEHYERKDYELFYLKIVYETYLKEVLQVKDEKDRNVNSVDDEGLKNYVNEHHPRFY
jgi:predicted membrane-bound dolichyl-phosphate-mannose-protein mannosyltransferase